MVKNDTVFSLVVLGKGEGNKLILVECVKDKTARSVVIIVPDVLHKGLWNWRVNQHYQQGREDDHQSKFLNNALIIPVAISFTKAFRDISFNFVAIKKL